jgi:CobW/HypB/UreG, nucleotide-binding domain
VNADSQGAWSAVDPKPSETLLPTGHKKSIEPPFTLRHCEPQRCQRAVHDGIAARILTLRDCLTRGATAAHTSRRDRGRRRHRQRHERGQCRRTAHEERQRIALARRRAARRDAERMICCTLREDLLVEVSKLAREGRDDYLLVESRGNSEPLPAAEPRLGRRTALTFPLLPPPQKN